MKRAKRNTTFPQCPARISTSGTIEEPEELNPAHLEELLKECGATRVVLEYNGMWQLQQLFQNLPDDWAVYQEMFFADATTFLQYNANMRSLVVDKLNTCELVVFNRFTKDMDKMEFHKLVAWRQPPDGHRL